MVTLLKKQLLLKLMSHALYVGLDAFPKVGAVVKLACGWWHIIKEAQSQVGDAERIEQVEQAGACSPEEAQQAADVALAKLREQGQSLNAERVEAVRDIIAVMPSQIRARTQATLSHARRLGTEVAVVLPVTNRFKEDAQEAFYASLVPQRRPQFRAGDELPGADDWHLERLIGAGGFGEVWLARNDSLYWAVKFCQDQNSAKLLIEEKSSLHVLMQKLPKGTAHIAALLNTRFKSMPYWLAFEYIDGGTLESRMRLGAMTWLVAWELFKPLVEGMAHVHKLGIVHRDLKPANILLDAQQRPRIADFGIGKVLAARDAATRRVTSTHTTRGFGTFGYMSPEQAAGKLAAHPTDDVYALGVILWQMLAGNLDATPEYPDDIQDLQIPELVKKTINLCRFTRRDKRPQNAEALLALLTPPPDPVSARGLGYGINYIETTINDFLESVLSAQQKFIASKEAIEQKVSRIETILNDFYATVQRCSNIIKESGGGEIGAQAHAELQRQLEWREQIDLYRKGVTFISKFEESFIVVVYGKVRAGKSTLGNFIRGKQIASSRIMTRYRKLTLPSIEVYDKGSLTTVDELKEMDEEDEFGVKSTEATRVIQLFTLGGLTWVDTPGIGSITTANEQLAQEYVQNADLVLYLTNSDAAAAQQDFRELKSLQIRNKPVCLVVTRCDQVEEDEDASGNIIKRTVPKPDKDIKAIENWIINEAKKSNVSDILNKNSILFISVKLAQDAIKQADANIFRASNMDRLYKRLAEIMQDNAIEYKIRNPQAKMNSFINDIIHGLRVIQKTYEVLLQVLAKKEYECKLLGKNYYFTPLKEALTSILEAATEAELSLIRCRF